MEDDGDNAQSARSIHKRKVDNRATRIFFQIHHDFPTATAKVLCDMRFMKHLADNNINPLEALGEILERKVKLHTTQCIMKELNEESKDKLDKVAFNIESCKHMVQDHNACVENMIGNTNERKFFYATVADHDLYLKMQKKPGVPIIIGMGEKVVLQNPSERQSYLVFAFGEGIPKGVPLEEVNEVVLFYKRYYQINFPPEVLVDGPSLQHLAVNGLNLNDIARVVGTNRNSVYTTSCILEDIKRKKGENMSGALIMAKGLIHAFCGHISNVEGHDCYESTLLKGKHIGVCFESNSGLQNKTERLEGVPFIITKNKKLLLMPPSKTLIESHHTPLTEKAKLLDLLEKFEDLSTGSRKEMKAEKKRKGVSGDAAGFAKKKRNDGL